MTRPGLLCSFVLASLMAVVAPAVAQVVPVTLVIDANGAHLERQGVPYTVKGAGGDASMDALANAGGNTLRTWGMGSDTQAFLDNAHARGLTVSLGIWLGHTNHGFDYTNPQQLAAQLENAREAVLAFRNHPAVLVWGIGNEMEGFGAGDNDAIWDHVEEVAAMVKSLDPFHPTMTTIAEIGGDRIQKIHQRCPSIDIVGINSYGGASSIPQRYAAAGGTKPYMLTEYGIWGANETGQTAWGQPWEPTSTIKGGVYRNVYEAIDADPNALGSVAFIWGEKREATITWFGMFLEDGSTLQAVDDLTLAWGGPALTNRCPRIIRFESSDSGSLDPGDTFHATLIATDPDGHPLDVEYRLFAETADQGPGDDAPLPAEYSDSITASSATGVSLTAPPFGCDYRLYAFVRDGQGAAATANIPLFVTGDTEPPAEDLPVAVYGDGADSPWTPSGYMGDTGAISMNANDTTGPRSGETALRVRFGNAGGWGGVVWQSPANNWGSAPGGIDLTGADALRFWARGAQGGEQITAGYGIVGGGAKYPDSSQNEIVITLTDEWQHYTIPLDGRDLSHIISGFYWTLGGQGQPVVFYLDDIRYARTAPAVPAGSTPAGPAQRGGVERPQTSRP